MVVTAAVFVLTAETIEPQGGAASAQAGDLLTLTGPEARHAVGVRRLRPGERVDLVDGDGLRLVCQVAASTGQAGKDRLPVEVLARVQEPPAPLRLALAQALAKGDRDEQAVETATEVGVELVLPWQAERCVSVWKGARAGKGRQRWQSTAQAAAKQARRARVPVVQDVRSTKSLGAWVEQVVAEGGVVLLLHEEASDPLSSVVLPRRAAVGGAAPVLAVVVGPEGGVDEAERQLLERCGARTVRLGPHVMRTSSAGPVALAVLAQRAGMWG